jgi:probable phosphoglycerate mutase
MTLKLYLLRNAETPASRSGHYCGVLDVDLTPAGYDMANHFAKCYQNLPWTAIFSSPLRRAIATATPMSKMVGLPIQVRPELREITYGCWEGKFPEEVDAEFHDEYVRWLADPGWNCPTGGERGIDVARRSSRVLEEIEHTYPTGDVLVVTHKSTLRLMLCTLLGIDVGRYRDRIAMPVASLTIVELARGGPLVQVMGDRSHLPDAQKRFPLPLAT